MFKQRQQNQFFFSAQPVENRSEKALTQQVPKLNSLKLASYNCKNIRTSSQTVHNLLKDNYFVFIQEHWLFQCNLHRLNQVSDDICFAAKSVDFLNPIEPIQMPRGFGGVAILWKNIIDKQVLRLEDGNERIQCVEYTTSTSAKIYSVPKKKCALFNFEYFEN